MDFITDNIVWIVVGLVVVIMTVIGYIAEKTDFGKKEMSKRVKNAKPAKEKPAVVEITPEPLVGSDTELLEPMEPLDDMKNDSKEKKNKKEKNSEESIFDRIDSMNENFDTSVTGDIHSTDNLTMPLTTEPAIDVTASENIDPALLTPLTSNHETYTTPSINDLSAPLGHEKSILDDLSSPLSTTRSERYVEPNIEIEPVREEFHEPILAEPKVSSIDQLDEPVLPDLESLRSGTVSNEEDDIWKF